MATPNIRTEFTILVTFPWSSIYNFGNLSLVIITIYFMPRSREEDFKEIMHFHSVTCMATPQRKGVMKFYNFGGSFLGHNYYVLKMYGPCTEEEKIFLRNTPILHFFPLGLGFIIFTISCLLTLQMIHTKFFKIGKVVLEKKIITHDGRQPQQQVT